VNDTVTVQLAFAFSNAPQVVLVVKSAALKLADCPATATTLKVMLVTAAEEVFVTVRTDGEVAPPTSALQKVKPFPNGQPGGGAAAIFRLFVAAAASVDLPGAPAITANAIAVHTQTTSSRRTKLSRLRLSI
jgi:hypothetical protein